MLALSARSILAQKSSTVKLLVSDEDDALTDNARQRCSASRRAEESWRREGRQAAFLSSFHDFARYSAPSLCALCTLRLQRRLVPLWWAMEAWLVEGRRAAGLGEGRWTAKPWRPEEP